MSQAAFQGVPAVSSQALLNSIQGAVAREEALLGNLTTLRQSVSTAGDYLSVLQDNEKLESYKQLMSELGQLAHEITMHQNVLSELPNTYRPSLEPTDFKSLIQEHLEAKLANRPYDPRADPEMQEFLQAYCGDGGGSAEGGGGEELGEDDELLVEDGGRRWANDKCPLSLKDVMDLEIPVKDSKGYVYERTAILDYLRRNGGHKHPVAGVNHVLTEAELQLAKDVIAAKKRARLRAAMGGGGGGGGQSGQGGGGGGQEEVIDV